MARRAKKARLEEAQGSPSKSQENDVPMLDETPQISLANGSTDKPSHLSQWQQMISEAVHSIVSIRFSQVASFDTEQATTSEG
jgi:hypothetical protein